MTETTSAPSSPPTAGDDAPEPAETSSSPPPAPVPSKRGRYAVVAVVVVALVAIAIVATHRSSAPPADTNTGAVATTTAKIETRTLQKTDSVDGNLDYATSRPVINQKAGTLTSAPDSGTTIDRGQTLYTVDNKPVVLLFGDTPIYRQMDQSSAAGSDVKQLKENLVALGFGSGLADDGTYDADTAYDVERWENSVGLDGDGIVALGEALFLPGAVRMSATKINLGSSAAVGAEAVTVSENTKVVTAPLDATKAGEVKQGDSISVILPNGKTATGKVQSVGPKPASSSGGGAASAAGGGAAAAAATTSSTNQAIIAFDDEQTVSAVNSGPVKVKVVSSTRTNVKAAPVTALIALAEGGYALQVANGGKLVAATPGLIADGWAEITSDIPVGTAVVVPK
jgi:hypothetical protein